MDKTVEHGVDKAEVDRIQERLVSYACDLQYDNLPTEAVHAAKVRIIDTFGALIGGFFDESSRLARDVAAETPSTGATVIGTRMKTTPDIAAFANGTAARSVEMNDYARKPGGRNGHPSDVVTPVFAAAEHMQASGRDYIAAVVLAYEVYTRFADAISDNAFDSVNFCCLGTAVAAGKILGLSPHQLSHCISIAAVPSNALGQTRTGRLSMWKAVATGEAGRAGVFAALLARKGMEGPYLPFEGKNGWCNHVAHKQLSLDTMGGNGVRFGVQDSVLKPRAACFHTLSPILAAEKVAVALKSDIKDVKHVNVEVYRYKERTASNVDPNSGVSDPHWWNPESREIADHSIPYAVAATLMEGTVTPRSFDDAHLWNPELRALLKKIEVVENKEFTAAYGRLPVQHCSRVTVTTGSGERIVGESGGAHGGLADIWSDAAVADKFRGLTEDFLGAKQANAILDRLWNLEDVKNVAGIPPAFVLD